MPHILSTRAAYVVTVAFLSAAVFSCGGSEGEEDEYALRLGDVIDTVNQAGFGIAQPILDVQSCTGEQACLDGGDTLAAEFKTYNRILREQVDILNSVDAPYQYADLHSLYTEQLQLRIEAGEMIIEGWESLDDALLNDGFERFRDSQAKFSEILDELQSLQSD